MNYLEAVEYIQSFPDMERGTPGSRGLTMGLDSMRSLLDRLDNPQKDRNTVHVTGSKGKGSTSTMIAAILQAAGYRTALYTSPHLHSYTERIALGLEPISEEMFAASVAEIQPHIEEEGKKGNGSLSTFGILTALFFYMVRKAAPVVDWQIVEVGMGGRYDATNVMEQKNLVIITPISLEHIEVLGSSQTEIASNKAAIITSGCTAVLAPQKDASVRSVIGRQCHQVGAGLVDVGSKAFAVKRKHQDLHGQTFELISSMGNIELQTPMLGGHQATNAAVAAVSAQVLARAGATISDQAIQTGLAKTSIPGRLELMPPVQVVGEPTILVDGAHNHESATALSDALKNLFPERKVIFVIGVNNDKNINAIWRELNSLSKMVITTKSHNLRAMDPEALSDAVSFQATGLARATTSVIEAMNLALQEAKLDDVICVTGSLYVVAEARDYLLKRSAKP